MNILTVNFAMNILIFGIVAWIYVWPRLRVLDLSAALVPILLLHSFRHLGLMFLERGATVPGIASEFTRPAAFGDLLASILALIALLAVIRRFRYALLLVWIFNIEGTIDFIVAVVLANKYQAVHYMGAAYWIPALWVPALLVTHFLAFRLLLRRR
jgi:hypothetical protein